MISERPSHPNPQNLSSNTFHGKGDFADVINLMILLWEDYLGLSKWNQCNHKASYKRETGVVEREDDGDTSQEM